jgi:predicted DNA-binding transcriptional regulator AlpA
MKTKIGRRLVGFATVAERLGLHEDSIRRLIRQGRFPKPFPKVPGGRAVAWCEDTIDQYIAEREASVK